MKQNTEKNRVAVFVDGFNVYHFLDKTEGFEKYKWLDYKKLSNLYLSPDSNIISIHYFTAFATWNQRKFQRHRLYIKALRTKGIVDVVGKFKHVTRKFIVEDNTSTQRYKIRTGYINGRVQIGYTFEEKQTDVNIAVYMISMAAKDEYDIALLISGDTDFEPVLDTILNRFPGKEVRVVVPNRRIAGSLRHLVGPTNCVQIQESHLQKSQLEDEITLPSGSIITRPSNWT